MKLHIWYAIARNVIKKNTERKMNKEKLDKQLRILESVAEKLVNGCLTSGNIAHDGKTKGYTIQNVVNNIRRIVADDADQKDFMERSCEFLKEHAEDYAYYDHDRIFPESRVRYNTDSLLNDFKKLFEK